jgi:hypothetical protein
MLYRCCTCTSNKRRVFFSPLLYIEEEEQETSYKKNKEENIIKFNRRTILLIEQSSCNENIYRFTAPNSNSIHSIKCTFKRRRGARAVHAHARRIHGEKTTGVPSSHTTRAPNPSNDDESRRYSHGKH